MAGVVAIHPVSVWASATGKKHLSLGFSRGSYMQWVPGEREQMVCGSWPPGVEVEGPTIGEELLEPPRPYPQLHTQPSGVAGQSPCLPAGSGRTQHVLS